MGSRIVRAVRAHPLLVFIGLTYVLSWWPWLLYPAGLSPSPVIGFGPFLAALIAFALTQGRPGVFGLMRSMLR